MIHNKIFNFFDKLEDKIRAHLSRHPIGYALIGAVGIILFWRGVWHMADDINMNSVVSTIIGAIILLMTGVFVSAFIGSRIILSGLKGEEKIVEKTEKEVKIEKSQIDHLENTLHEVEEELEKVKEEIQKNHEK